MILLKAGSRPLAKYSPRMFEKHFQKHSLPIIIFKFLVNDDVVDDRAVQMSKRNMQRFPQESRLDGSRNK